MSTERIFTNEELQQLRGFPEITHADLIKYFRLTPSEMTFLRQFRRPSNVIGVAVQLCTLPWLGFVPDDVTAAPEQAVARLADQLVMPVAELRDYGTRKQARTEHLHLVADYLKWRVINEDGWKELDEMLFSRAMEHESPKDLFKVACEYLMAVKTVRPGVTTLLKHIATAREAGTNATWERVAHLVSPERAEELDALLRYDAGLGSNHLTWLTMPPMQANPAGVKMELAKLDFLRRLDADTLDLSGLPKERRRSLALKGRKLTGQQLERRDGQRRYPMLLTVLVESAIEVLDDSLTLFDQALSGRESFARKKRDEALAERAKAGEGRQQLLNEILEILLDTSVDDENVGTLIRTGIGMERIREAHAVKFDRLPRDHGLLAMLGSSWTYVRQFAPMVLEAIRFSPAVEATEPLVKAVDMLRELNATGARKVPDGAPADFVPAKWEGYLKQAVKDNDTTAHRHYWELCVLLALRDGLRSGDVYVPGSRRYADPSSFLITPEEWETKRFDFCLLTGIPRDADDALPHPLRTRRRQVPHPEIHSRIPTAPSARRPHARRPAPRRRVGGRPRSRTRTPPASRPTDDPGGVRPLLHRLPGTPATTGSPDRGRVREGLLREDLHPRQRTSPVHRGALLRQGAQAVPRRRTTGRSHCPRAQAPWPRLGRADLHRRPSA